MTVGKYQQTKTFDSKEKNVNRANLFALTHNKS